MQEERFKLRMKEEVKTEMRRDETEDEEEDRREEGCSCKWRKKGSGYTPQYHYHKV